MTKSRIDFPTIHIWIQTPIASFHKHNHPICLTERLNRFITYNQIAKTENSFLLAITILVRWRRRNGGKIGICIRLVPTEELLDQCWQWLISTKELLGQYWQQLANSKPRFRNCIGVIYFPCLSKCQSLSRFICFGFYNKRVKFAIILRLK